MNELILLVEDNEQILRGNERMLRRRGYAVKSALDLAGARAAIAERRPAAIILDIMLPDGSGLDFIGELRNSENSGIPVLLLTGLSTQDDIVRGLTEGGDDYLTKPYDFPVLLARVEALMRRAARVPEKIVKDRLTLDVAAGVALLDGKDLLLAQKEFALLLIFLQNEERYINGDYLCEKVWKAPMEGDSDALKSAVKRLRAKIRGSGWHIGWSRGEGYALERE
ncbi:MAG: response regulator transcription factor [Clostridiales bacterium]|nr:response regulator transcription factor [Clostridiales bacterium]